MPKTSFRKNSDSPDKAIKALREMQAWRLETLESVTEQNGFVLENNS
jgi:hypothetical protein